MIRHADRRDHGIEGENDIEQHDLHDHGGEARPFFGGTRMSVLTFKFLVNLHDALADQEQAAHQ